MMVRSGIVLLAIVAGLALAVAGHTAPAATHRTPPRILITPPSMCYAAGQTCSIHPCVEFVADRTLPRVDMLGPIPRLTRPVCIRQPSAQPERI
jgi:hypothetical protein